jgi:hypothetical protein
MDCVVIKEPSVKVLLIVRKSGSNQVPISVPYDPLGSLGDRSAVCRE